MHTNPHQARTAIFTDKLGMSKFHNTGGCSAVILKNNVKLVARNAVLLQAAMDFMSAQQLQQYNLAEYSHSQHTRATSSDTACAAYISVLLIMKWNLSYGVSVASDLQLGPN